MKKVNVYLLGLCFGMSVMFAGCNRDKDDNGFETATVEDHQQADMTFEEIEMMVTEAGAMGGREEDAAGGRMESCPTRTRNVVTRTITVDFGTTGCVGPDGRTRKGKIIHVMSGNLPNLPGHTVTTTFDNYSVNGNKVEGTHIKTLNGLNSSGQPYSTTQVINGKITFTDGTFITRNGQHVRTWVNAGGAMSDDEIHVTGSATGTSRQGVSYTVAITSPIIRKASCLASQIYYPVKGTETITPQNALARTVDFGNGTCDKVITVTVGNRTRTITLP